MENSKYKYTVVSREMLADLYTPVSLYLRLRYKGVQSALMECSDYHDRASARSFIATHPIGSIAIAHGVATLRLPDGAEERREINDGYTCDRALDDFISRFCIEGKGAEQYGLFGYTTFNAVRYFEHIAVKDETREENDAPDILYIMYRDIVALTTSLRSLTTVVQL